MNGFRMLLEKHWIVKEQDREAYYEVKRELPSFARFVRDQLGWRLIHTDHMIKLDKIPAHASGAMGIGDFTDRRDYCFLCSILIFLEDKAEGEQFLLSELIDFVEMAQKQILPVDWTNFSQRRSLVRVLKYVEREGMLIVYEHSSEQWGRETGQEVLYENTGLSRYFAITYARDLSEIRSWEDFEVPENELIETERGPYRIHQVYRSLLCDPAMYWKSIEDSLAMYLRHEWNWVSSNLEKYCGGRLDLHKNAAFFLVEENDPYGTVFPNTAMWSEAVLMVAAALRKMYASKPEKRRPDDTVRIPQNKLHEVILKTRARWKEAWSKEFREMEDDRLIALISQKLKDWMMIETQEESGEDSVILCPAVGKLAGYYPEDFESKEKEAKR